MENLSPTTPKIYVIHKTAITSSLAVAEYFGKRHKSVLRAIKNLECSEDFNRLNFAPRDYKDERGKTQPSFDITKDGFAMLAFGFTGKQASQFKERYINAFNEMLAGIPAERDDAIKAKRLAHQSMTDAIKIDRERQGKAAAPHHYIVENKLCNWAVRGEFKAINESTLPAWEAKLLERVRNYDEALIIDGVDYQTRKAKLRPYADRQRVFLMPGLRLVSGKGA